MTTSAAPTFEDYERRTENEGSVDVGMRVRTLRTLDLGSGGKVEKGAVGVLESITNGPYLPYLVRFDSGTFAFEDGEIEPAPIDGAR